MSGGLFAIRGFDYQATVILDRILAHFEGHGCSATVRPEGQDDLDLHWISVEGLHCRRFEQIKKRHEDSDLEGTGQSWTLAKVASDLVPATLLRLLGNQDQQVWILGDDVESDVSSIVAAGRSASHTVPNAYWRLVHQLARKEALEATDLAPAVRKRLMRWRVEADFSLRPAEALTSLAERFQERLAEVGADSSLSANYERTARQFHERLVDSLDRIRIEPLYGSEEQIVARVNARLADLLDLDPAAIGATLFRNLRGFISDIAKQRGRHFDQAEFQWELRTVWPTVMPVRDPPPLEARHVLRRDLSAAFTTQWSGRALEAIGISGAGKTMLASEVCLRSQTNEPDRLLVYVEVRPETSLRDALVGVSFQLRRYGHDQCFAIAVDRSTPSGALLETLARALSFLPQTTLILLDLVQGTCNEGFARDLADFVRSLEGGASRVAVLGQESAFRTFSAYERDQCQIRRIDIRGFNVEEFTQLVTHRHVDPNHQRLHDVFRKVTAGRAAGLYAKLARSLADAPSLEAMNDLAQRPADEILSYADQQRFARLSPGAYVAAEKLLCFALPFDRQEATDAFPADNVSTAIRELSNLGLLRLTGDNAYEMHESVRAGLERMMSTGARQKAHDALAAHYAREQNVTAEVYHLERAGHLQAAESIARNAFLRGECWSGLADFVTERQLITKDEVIAAVAGKAKIEDIYHLADVLVQLPGTLDARSIMAVLQTNYERLFDDYPWASALVEACLISDPGSLDQLIDIVFGVGVATNRRDAALSTILIAARRLGHQVGASTLALFDRLKIDDQRRLLSLLFASGRREALSRAFACICESAMDRSQKHGTGWSSNHLRIASQDDAIECLAALPAIPDHEILKSRSPYFGPLTPILWRHRQALNDHCICILERNDVEPSVQKAAIRALALFAEPRLFDLCWDLAKRSDNPVHGFAALAPTLLPNLVDHGRYQGILLEPSCDLQERVAALAV